MAMYIISIHGKKLRTVLSKNISANRPLCHPLAPQLHIPFSKLNFLFHDLDAGAQKSAK
jgi:hypothetical protein